MTKNILFVGLGTVVMGLLGLVVLSASRSSGEAVSAVTPSPPPVTQASQARGVPSEEAREKWAEPTVLPGIAPEVEAKKVEPVVAFAPDFTLPYLDGGGTYTLSTFRGDKPVIVDFFAEHCPNCRRNLPKMEKLTAQYGDQVEVILIGIDSESATRRYFTKRPTTLPIVMQDPSVGRAYGLRFTNTKALINRDGSLRDVLHGQDVTEQHFLDLIAS